jgi:hypothetical protein
VKKAIREILLETKINLIGFLDVIFFGATVNSVMSLVDNDFLKIGIFVVYLFVSSIPFYILNWIVDKLTK